jgi:hypothetical protein
VIHAIDYASAGALTDLSSIDAGALNGIPATPIEISYLSHGLVIQPNDAKTIGIPAERFDEKNARQASTIVRLLLELNPSPLHVERTQENRVVGTCRHFALLSCSMLRYRGFPARVRCGFTTYFQPEQALDHWITEYWDALKRRWIRVDSEIMGQSILEEPEDLAPGHFLSGGEAWAAFRDGAIDASRFGVYGTSNFGAAEIRGNAVKDLAALNKVEMLPWDEWGRMTEAYNNETGPDYDAILDSIARVTATNDYDGISNLYCRSDDLRVPDHLVR